VRRAGAPTCGARIQSITNARGVEPASVRSGQPSRLVHARREWPFRADPCRHASRRCRLPHRTGSRVLVPLLTIIGMCAGLGFSLYAIYLEMR